MAKLKKGNAKYRARRRTAAYHEYRHPERSPLIRELLENLRIAGTPLHAETQAFLWLSNISCLRSLVRKSRRLRGGDEGQINHSDDDDDDENNDHKENDDKDDHEEDEEDDESGVDYESDESDGDHETDENSEEMDESKDFKDYNLAPSLLIGHRSVKVSETCRSTEFKCSNAVLTTLDF